MKLAAIAQWHDSRASGASHPIVGFEHRQRRQPCLASDADPKSPMDDRSVAVKNDSITFHATICRVEPFREGIHLAAPHPAKSTLSGLDFEFSGWANLETKCIVVLP